MNSRTLALSMTLKRKFQRYAAEYGISVIFQNIAQLKNRYPNDEYLEILGNCDTQVARVYGGI